MKEATKICATQCVKPGLCPAVTRIVHNQQWLVKEHLLGFALAHAVLIGAFATVSLIPIEPFDPLPVDHQRIL